MSETTGRKKPLEQWQIEDAARLRELFEAKKVAVKLEGQKFSQDKFAADFGIASGQMVWQFLSALRPLNIKAAASFARGLGVRVEEFSPTLADQLGKVAESHTAPSLVENKGEQRELQWTNASEARLLSEFRMRSVEYQRAILSFANSLPGVIFDSGGSTNQG